MGRVLKRVPLDFDWPIDELWHGYLSGEDFPQCSDCGGEGYGPEARAIAHTFYPHQIASHYADRLAWHDKLGQVEVDHLQAQGRLRTWRDGAWHNDPLTADEVNQRQRGGGFDGHDGINRWILIRFRCERLGIEVNCSICAGHGTIATDAERAKAEEWEPTEPPEGEGYQLWNTTTEGHPMTPVFATLDELCAHAAEHCSTFGYDKASAEGWKHMLTDGIVGSTMVKGDGTQILMM